MAPVSRAAPQVHRELTNRTVRIVAFVKTVSEPICANLNAVIRQIEDRSPFSLLIEIGIPHYARGIRLHG